MLLFQRFASTSYNFIRWPITPNPIDKLSPLSLSFVLHFHLRPVNHAGVHTCVHVCANVTARDFLPFSGGSDPANKRGESNDKAFTRAAHMAYICRRETRWEYADNGKLCYERDLLLSPWISSSPLFSTLLPLHDKIPRTRRANWARYAIGHDEGSMKVARENFVRIERRTSEKFSERDCFRLNLTSLFGCDPP